MLFYFMAAVHTSAIKYSTITVQRKYVVGEILISAASGNLAYVIDVTVTCALVHGSSRLAANLKMSDISGDSCRQLNSIFWCLRSERKK